MWAVLPIKDVTDAKQRLAAVLTPDERQHLFRTMAADVLRTLVHVRGLDGVMVVTRDPWAMELAQELGARVHVEAVNAGHTAAVTAAATRLRDDGADGMLQVPGDVPLIAANEIERVLAAHGEAPAMTIVPAHDERGSNCVACSPPDAVPLRFGNDSFKPHLEVARGLGIEPVILKLPGLALDIDTPDDLHALLAQPGDTATHHYLRDSGIAARLPEPADLAAEAS